MADKDAFCYPYHVHDCTPPQEKLPNKGSFHSEMPPKNSVSKSHSFISSCILVLKHDISLCFGFTQPQT